MANPINISNAGETQPATRFDAARAANERLRVLSYPQLRQIGCEFHAGVLTLRGRVDSYFLRQMAHCAVKTIQGVEVVSDRLEVLYPPIGSRRSRSKTIPQSCRSK